MEFYEVRERRIRIENLNERIERLRSAMEIGSRRMQLAPAKSGIRDRLAENMAKLDELECALVGEVARLETEIQQAELMLEGWPEHYQRIVRLRYVDGLTWEKIARKANYSTCQCRRICKKVLGKD